MEIKENQQVTLMVNNLPGYKTKVVKKQDNGKLLLTGMKTGVDMFIPGFNTVMKFMCVGTEETGYFDAVLESVDRQTGTILVKISGDIYGLHKTRDALRINVSAPVALSFINENYAVKRKKEGLIKDVSIKGCRILIDTEELLYKQGDRIYISFYMGPRFVTAIGEIRHITDDKPKEQRELGIMFLSLLQEDEKLIMQAVREEEARI